MLYSTVPVRVQDFLVTQGSISITYNKLINTVLFNTENSVCIIGTKFSRN